MKLLFLMTDFGQPIRLKFNASFCLQTQLDGSLLNLCIHLMLFRFKSLLLYIFLNVPSPCTLFFVYVKDTIFLKPPINQGSLNPVFDSLNASEFDGRDLRVRDPDGHELSVTVHTRAVLKKLKRNFCGWAHELRSHEPEVLKFTLISYSSWEVLRSPPAKFFRALSGYVEVYGGQVLFPIESAFLEGSQQKLGERDIILVSPIRRRTRKGTRRGF